MSTNSPSLVRWAVAVVLLTLGADATHAAGRIYGECRFEKIKGNPGMGYVGTYENDLFLAPSSSPPVGFARRLGTTRYNGSECYNMWPQYGGFYCIPDEDAEGELEAGTYSILVNMPDFFVCPKVVPNIVIPDYTDVEVNFELPIDYSTYFRDSGEWTVPGNTWYQTFIATGRYVRGVAFVIADSGPSSGADVSILKDNGNPDVRNWQVIGTRREPAIGANTDNWVRWRSGEIPLEPGTQHAVRITGVGGTIQPYKRDKDAQSYAGGRAYNEHGTAQNFDLNYVVFADNDGTVVTMNKRGPGVGRLDHDPVASGWAQSFTAQGNSLAGADVFAAGEAGEWDLDFQWKVRDGGPYGPQIGPTKVSRAAWFGPGAGLYGVSYTPGEVPLVPGHTYFIEFFLTDPPTGVEKFKPYVTDDPYDGGVSWRWNGSSWNQKPSHEDFSMTILEYKPEPLIELSTATISRSVYLGETLSDDTFTVANGTFYTLDYQVTDNADWLAVLPIGGSSTGEADVITVSYSETPLPFGTHSAIITVSGNATNSPQQIAVHVRVHTVDPDFDGDYDVDQHDFGHLQHCYSGPGVRQDDPDCLNARLDEDEDVDLEDFGILQACMSGANIPAARDCAD